MLRYTWRCQMARDIGAGNAELIGADHGIWGENPPGGRQMEFNNNAIGRRLSTRSGACSSLCSETARNDGIEICVGAGHLIRPSGLIHLCLIFLAVLGLQGCGWLSESEIVVRNVGGVEIHDVKLEVGGGVNEVGAIPVGEGRKVSPEIVMDSSLLVFYVENGKSLVCDGDVYFTNNLHVKVEADVGGGVCRIREVAG